MKKKMLPPFLVPINEPLLLTILPGFYGVFPGSPPNPIGPASSASLAPFSPSNLLRCWVSFIPKKGGKK